MRLFDIVLLLQLLVLLKIGFIDLETLIKVKRKLIGVKFASKISTIGYGKASKTFLKGLESQKEFVEQRTLEYK
eukprot:snap_masked-scaffold_18-processed-gene-6.26-mRNA-1 protein AED:1.00 eAED:1.00 QI:0/0/0/0/1/1/2/0/73